MATIQKYTTAASQGLINAINLLSNSDAVYSDASFVRCKNLSVSYTFPSAVREKLKIKEARVYILGQNLFTLTKYTGADPENQNVYVLPPLRTLTCGIQFKF